MKSKLLLWSGVVLFVSAVWAIMSAMLTNKTIIFAVLAGAIGIIFIVCARKNGRT